MSFKFSSPVTTFKLLQPNQHNFTSIFTCQVRIRRGRYDSIIEQLRKLSLNAGSSKQIIASLPETLRYINGK